MHEDMEESHDALIEDLKRSIDKIEAMSSVVKAKNPTLYEEIQLVIKSLRFYLENGAVNEFIKEIDDARKLIKCSQVD